jgi:hypothetical protein
LRLIIVFITLATIVLSCLSPSLAEDSPSAAASPYPSPTPSSSPLPGDAVDADASPDFGSVVTPTRWVSLEEEVSPTYDGLSGSSSTINFRAQLPLGSKFSLPFIDRRLPLQLIKLKLPFVTSAPRNAISGNGDTTLVGLQYLGTQEKGVSFGPAFKLPTASTSALGSGKWSVGPAGGYTYTNPDGMSAFGIYTQSFFSFAGDGSRPSVSQTQLQPTAFFALGPGFSIGTSTMQFTYNWELPGWTDVPLGIRIAQDFAAGSGKLTAGFEAEKNLINTPGAIGWTLRVNFRYRFKKTGS